MRLVNRAILLLAGRGRRLRDLTDHRPKCLLEIAGMTILERALLSLTQCGVTEAILVVGYKADRIRQIAYDRSTGIDLKYVVNDRHAETGTAYSLWLAKNYLDADCLLLEGDILFDVQAPRRILRCSDDKPVWAAVPVTKANNEGVLLRKCASGYVAEVQLVRQPEHRPPALSYKCAGIQLLTASMAQSFASKLDAAIISGQTHQYADLVLSELLDGTSMVLCSLEGLRWGEVDDLEDLHRVERLFATSSDADATSFAKSCEQGSKDE